MKKSKNLVEVDSATRKLIIDFLSRKDVCRFQVGKLTGISSQHLSKFSEMENFDRDKLAALDALARKGEPVPRKQWENKSLTGISDTLRSRLAAYIERNDVCISAVERLYELNNGTLRRIARGETSHTKEDVVRKIAWIVEKNEANPRQAPEAHKLDRNKVIELFNAGHDARKIANTFQVSRAAVYLILKEHGFEMTVPASGVISAVKEFCQENNITVSSFCMAKGIHTSFIYSKGSMQKRHAERIMGMLAEGAKGIPKINPGIDLVRLDELLAQGKTHSQIAQEFGVHIVTIARAIKRLKLEK